MFFAQNNPKSVKEKYEEFKRDNQKLFNTGEFLTFKSSAPSGSYFCNPSAPFIYEGKKVICVRLCTMAEVDDGCAFFEMDGNLCTQITGAQTFKLQDPYIAEINGEYILGGVKGWKVDSDKWSWLCEFYRSNNIVSFKHLLTGPTLMKDIRLAQLKSGGVGVFTRPQGVLYRKTSGHIADIGYTGVNSVDDLDCTKMVNAPALKGVFKADEWGGVNQVYKLSNGLLGVLGHIAYGDGEFREGLTIHYYGMAFAFNPVTLQFTDPKIIVSKDCFENIPEASPRTADVIFSGGLERLGNGKAIFYSGVSDRRVGRVEIDDPFAEFERLKI